MIDIFTYPSITQNKEIISNKKYGFHKLPTFSKEEMEDSSIDFEIEMSPSQSKNRIHDPPILKARVQPLKTVNDISRSDTPRMGQQRVKSKVVKGGAAEALFQKFNFQGESLLNDSIDMEILKAQPETSDGHKLSEDTPKIDYSKNLDLKNSSLKNSGQSFLTKNGRGKHPKIDVKQQMSSLRAKDGKNKDKFLKRSISAPYQVQSLNKQATFEDKEEMIPKYDINGDGDSNDNNNIDLSEYFLPQQKISSTKKNPKKIPQHTSDSKTKRHRRELSSIEECRPPQPQQASQQKVINPRSSLKQNLASLKFSKSKKSINTSYMRPEVSLYEDVEYQASDYGYFNPPRNEIQYRSMNQDKKTHKKSQIYSTFDHQAAEESKKSSQYTNSNRKVSKARSKLSSVLNKITIPHPQPQKDNYFSKPPTKGTGTKGGQSRSQRPLSKGANYLSTSLNRPLTNRESKEKLRKSHNNISLPLSLSRRVKKMMRQNPSRKTIPKKYYQTLISLIDGVGSFFNFSNSCK